MNIAEQLRQLSDRTREDLRRAAIAKEIEDKKVAHSYLKDTLLPIMKQVALKGHGSLCGYDVPNHVDVKAMIKVLVAEGLSVRRYLETSSLTIRWDDP